MAQSERHTRVLPMNEESINLAVRALREGGLVAYPTDTVYGLGAHAFILEAVERVFEVKARPHNAPLPLLLADADDLPRVAREVPEAARRLAEAFWPGGLSIVLPRSPAVPSLVTGGGEGVAVRVPDHQALRTLIRRLGAPITGTSANLSGHPSPTTVEEVQEQLGGRIELILDGGRCPGGVPSSVVDLIGQSPRLVREGAISRESLERVLPELRAQSD